MESAAPANPHAIFTTVLLPRLQTTIKVKSSRNKENLLCGAKASLGDDIVATGKPVAHPKGRITKIAVRFFDTVPVDEVLNGAA